MDRVLLIEDSPMVAKILRHLASGDPNLEIEHAPDLKTAQRMLAEADAYLAAVVDLNLPDAPNGEALDVTLLASVPSIVLTGTFDAQVRDSIIQKGVADYVVKESRYSYEYVIQLLRRMQRNRSIKVLVADDSLTSRRLICNLLQQHLFQVIEAENGARALELLQQHDDIKLLITDYNMPELDGFELTREARRLYAKDRLIIIGLSAQSEGGLSARFIKIGANDFLAKPFWHEEFHCRVMHNLEFLEQLEQIREAAHRDGLTRLHNRTYFFETARERLQQAEASGRALFLTLFDIDHFKRINDCYGHDAGDQALRAFARILREHFADEDVCRFGGEEFVLLLEGVSPSEGAARLESLREQVEDYLVLVGAEHLNFTVSAGFTTEICPDLETMIKQADNALYEAKEQGRNMVVGR